MEAKTYNIAELNTVFTLLGRCVNDKDLKNPSSILSIIRVTKKIEENIKMHSEEQREILEKFNVPQVQKEQGAMYDWSSMDPESQLKIQSLINELNKTKYSVIGFNKVNEDDFVAFTKGLDMQSVAFLWDYLVEE
jgi:hypothetical protein